MTYFIDSMGVVWINWLVAGTARFRLLELHDLGKCVGDELYYRLDAFEDMPQCSKALAVIKRQIQQGRQAA